MSYSDSINKDWEKYYIYLEKLRQSGETNMYGAAPYLEQAFPETKDMIDGSKLSYQILVNWMNNYDALASKYRWR